MTPEKCAPKIKSIQEQDGDGEQRDLKVYKYRWIILLIFSFLASVSFVQFLQFSIISNVVAHFYVADSLLVDLTSLTYMISAIVLCVPVNFLILKYSLRVVVISAAVLTALGNLLKLLSASPDRIDVVIISQFLCAIANVLIVSIVSRVASTWFGKEQVSSASALAVFGLQIGLSAGTISSPLLVPNSDDLDQISSDFFRMHIINSSISVFVLVLVVLFFRAKPNSPPSYSQLMDGEEATGPLAIRNHLLAMVKNRNYLLLLFTFGICNGMWSTFGIVANRVYLFYFPGMQADLGIMASVSIFVGGCLGSIFFGYLLDTFHQFRITTFVSFFTGAITYIFVIYSYESQGRIAAFLTFPAFSFFVGSSLALGFEFATEILHPIPQAIACSVMNATNFVFTLIFTFVLNALFDSVGYFYSQVFIFVLLFLNSGLVYFLKDDLNRLKANNNQPINK